MMNPFKDTNWNPGLRERKSFARSLVFGFPCIAAIFLTVGWFATHTWKPFFLWLGVIGCAVGVVLWVLPQIAKPFYVVWYFIACCMGIVMGNLLFAVIFYLIFTPFGLIRRSTGHSPLGKHFDKSKETYWEDAEKSSEVRRYYRQF